MNYLWAFMILGGVVFSAFYGTLPAVTGAVLDSAKEAVTLCITMAGVMSFWMGLMRIAEKCGIIADLSRKLKPVLRFLFPKIPPDHIANEYIATNMIANVFGLGWAATPAGLKAMESLEKLEESRREQQQMKVLRIQNENTRTRAQRTQNKMINPMPRGTANDEMCTFLIINIHFCCLDQFTRYILDSCDINNHHVTNLLPVHQNDQSPESIGRRISKCSSKMT